MLGRGGDEARERGGCVQRRFDQNLSRGVK